MCDHLVGLTRHNLAKILEDRQSMASPPWGEWKRGETGWQQVGIGATCCRNPIRRDRARFFFLQCRFEKWWILYRFRIFDACSRVLQFGDALQFEEPRSIVGVVSLDGSDKIEIENIWSRWGCLIWLIFFRKVAQRRPPLQTLMFAVYSMIIWNLKSSI